MLNDIDRWENEGGRYASQAPTIAAATATRLPMRDRPHEAASRVVGGDFLNRSRHHDGRFVTPSFGDAGRPHTRQRP